MNSSAQLGRAFESETLNSRFDYSSLESLNISSVRVRVPPLNSRWVQELEERLNELTSLPRGWDGHIGSPVAFTCAQFAAQLIENLCVEDVPAPKLVPGSDGTLQLEWHMNQFDLEIDVLAPYNIIASRFDHLTGNDIEIEVQTDFTELANWVLNLGADRSEPQRLEN